MNAVVAIGRNVNGEPMSAEYWASFINTVNRACKRAGVLISTIIGDSHSDEWGQEEAAWFVLSVETCPDEFTERLDAIRNAFWQDAIAVTFGDTVLVGDV